MFFGISALSLIGIPPLSGFLSKWYISAAALSAEIGGWGVLIPVTLIISAILTAGYLLPIVIDGFFGAKEEKKGNRKEEIVRIKESPLMVASMGALSALTVLCGLFGSKIVGVIEIILGM